MILLHVTQDYNITLSHEYSAILNSIQQFACMRVMYVEYVYE